MIKRRRVLLATVMQASIALAAMAGLAGQSLAQSYPHKQIRIIVPFAAGSGTDAVARVIGVELAKVAHVPVIIENVPGANGILGSQMASKAAPDGYTILMATGTTHAANVALYKKLSYDPAKDFEPIAKTAEAPLVLVVRPESPFRTISDFLAAAKARKPLSFAASSGASRVAGEMLKSSLKGDLLHVPYKGSPQALTDVMGGQVDFMIVDMGPAMPLIQAGKLRALAVTSLEREPRLPDVPTFPEGGLKAFELMTWGAAFAPAGTPKPIVDKLNGWLRQVVQTAVVKDRFTLLGLTAVSSSSEELRTYVQNETAKWVRIVKEAGIEPE